MGHRYQCNTIKGKEREGQVQERERGRYRRERGRYRRELQWQPETCPRYMREGRTENIQRTFNVLHTTSAQSSHINQMTQQETKARKVRKKKYFYRVVGEWKKVREDTVTAEGNRKFKGLCEKKRDRERVTWTTRARGSPLPSACTNSSSDIQNQHYTHRINTTDHDHYETLTI